MTHYDKFGNGWPDGPGYENEYCPECGQPDNCGDCTHEPLDPEDVQELGGTLAEQEPEPLGFEDSMALKYPIIEEDC